MGPDELTRYSRHVLLPEVGIEGQSRLRSASVLVVGAGGLGCPAALYLAAAGVGRLGVVDDDTVDLSNLQRQILYGSPDLGLPKAEQAASRLGILNACIAVEPHVQRFSASTALPLLERYDLVIDGTDNFATRYLLNDACMLVGKPYVFGSIYRFEGQASVFTRTSGCYRCLFPEPPPADALPNCAEAGVLGVLAGIIGVIQATEALKLILGIGASLAGRLLIYDALTMNFNEVNYGRLAHCTACGAGATVELREETFACMRSGSALDEPLTAPTCATSAYPEVTPETLEEMMRLQSPIVLDVRSPEEHAICRLPGSILIPFAELENRLDSLDRQHPTVVYCKSGLRSRKAVQLLLLHGFTAVTSLQGGILAWAERIDTTLSRY